MRSSGRRIVFCLTLAFVALSCGRARTTPYERNADVALGHVVMRVSRIEPGEAPTTFQAAPEDRYYDVYVSVTGLPSVGDASDRHDYISNFFEHQVWLVDADGDRYRTIGAEMESITAYALGRASAPWWDDRHWVVRFRVPEASRDFTLLLKNPDVQDGQPALASVHLGTPGGV